MEVKIAPSFFKSITDMYSWKNKINMVRSWFHFHFNKNFIKLLKVVLKSYPWDEGYLYDIEKAKIEEMRKYHQKQMMFEGVEQVIRDMKICENLIDIFMEKKLSFEYSDKPWFEKNDDGTYRMVSNHDDMGYRCTVYVNTRNMDRFFPKNIPDDYKEYLKKHPHEIYIAKAKYLYHKIRLERDGAWWD